MGGKGSGRKLDAQPASGAGRLLHDYLAAQGPGSVTRMAGELHVSASTVWRWVVGQTTPALAQALAIAHTTRGAVPAEAWVKG